MSTLGRLNRIERAMQPGHPPLEEDQMDAEIERLAAEFEEREGPGAFAALLKQLEVEFAAGGSTATNAR